MNGLLGLAAARLSALLRCVSTAEGGLCPPASEQRLVSHLRPFFVHPIVRGAGWVEAVHCTHSGPEHFWPGATRLRPSVPFVAARDVTRAARAHPYLPPDRRPRPCPLQTQPKAARPDGPQGTSFASAMVVTIDPRKIGGTDVSFTVGCNVCAWEVTFGPEQEKPFDNVTHAGKARRVHCGANESMSGVKKCPKLTVGYEIQEAPQLVRSVTRFLPPTPHPRVPTHRFAPQGLRKQPVYSRPADGVWGDPVLHPDPAIVYRTSTPPPPQTLSSPPDTPHPFTQGNFWGAASPPSFQFAAVRPVTSSPLPLPPPPPPIRPPVQPPLHSPPSSVQPTMLLPVQPPPIRPPVRPAEQAAPVQAPLSPAEGIMPSTQLLQQLSPKEVREMSPPWHAQHDLLISEPPHAGPSAEVEVSASDTP